MIMNENLDPVLPENNEDKSTEEQSVVETNKEQSEVAEAPAMSENNSTLTKDQIIEQLKNLSMQEDVPSRSDVDALKQAFYKLRSADIEVQKASFVEEGNNLEDFVANVDPSEDVLKTFLAKIKEKRAKLAIEEERQKEENYNKKLEVIDAIHKLTESTDDFNKLYKEFKDLQQQWNEIKHVPAAKVKELWNAYQAQTEKFYDLIKINNEFRDYDFKKNLELKTAICEAAEKLIDEADSISAFHQLQNFHDQWREIGPVAKELREDLWTRFKNASTEINKKYQSHFEGLKHKEEENLEAKTAIIDELKAIDYTALTSLKLWDEKSKEVINLQAKWKTIGFVPKKVNTQIFEEFRALCDKFFENKSKFFKSVKEEMDANLEKKKALCAKAQELKDSTDWKKTGDILVAIQREWKTIGPVPRKYSDAIWKEFVSACDHFFEQKNKVFSSQKEEEVENLQKKKAIVEKINAIDPEMEATEAIKLVRELADEWHTIGFVPFKEKDKAYKEFHAAVDSHYDRLKIDRNERRMDSFKSSIEDNKGDNRKLLKERERLMHTYAKLKNDLQTYENNMSFLSISSKGGNSLLKDVTFKIEDLKNEMTVIEQKIDMIDDELDKKN